HETAGVSIAQYMAALDAGANQVDLSMSPASGGTCQPDVMTMYHALRGSEYDMGIDPVKVYEAEDVFKECMKDYFMPPEAKKVEPLIPLSPMPGGALTANTQMLRDNDLLDRYEEITKNMGEVVIKGGFGTSVTPVSQFYFQQAFNNTMFGPWKKIADGYGKMVLGYFGKTPVDPDPEVVKIAQEQIGMEPTTRLVVDINDENPALGIEAATQMLIDNGISDLSEENVFIAAACLDKGIQFLKGEAKANVRKNVKEEEEPVAPAAPAAPVAPAPVAVPTAAQGVTVTVNGRPYGVQLNGNTAIVNGLSYNVDVRAGIAAPAAAPVPVAPAPVAAAPVAPIAPAAAVRVAPAVAGGTKITAPMPGLVLRISVAVGDVVTEGDEVMVLEAMKMETPISATAGGTITEVHVSQGDQVKSGAVLVQIG
ncbi:MAG: biotin attachment protein, partial [Spirochaetes bacterium]